MCVSFLKKKRNYNFKSLKDIGSESQFYLRKILFYFILMEEKKKREREKEEIFRY